MDTNTETFCRMIRNRSDENRRAIRCFDRISEVLSPAMAILRQELDSMIRVIYLLGIRDIAERKRLISSTLQGKKWKVWTDRGKWTDVTDRRMVDFAQQLQGWTQSVYRFGCAFVHLSDFHNHIAENPLDKLETAERQNVLFHMRYYHGGPCDDNPKMAEFASYVPQVFGKIADNLDCYLKTLEADGTLDD
jgi:hypothetical protein